MNSGEIIDNHYELKRQLGRGSFGEVWLAIDTYLQQEVALKFYVAMDNNGRLEFRDEYSKVFRLRHENLLTPSHYAEWNGQPYLELEYCPASAAAQLGKLNEQQLWCFIADVAAGLAYMHATNPPLVHQDIKPANILQKTDGHYAITDFGISVSLRSTMLRQSGHEVSGSVGGSIPYMGPELFGAKPVPVMASDIWALGVTIYEMATGTLPFMGQGGVMLKNGAELPILEGYSPELNNLMQSCLAKDTWDRPTAENVAEQAGKYCCDVPPVRPQKTAEKPKTEYDDSATQKMPIQHIDAPTQKPIEQSNVESKDKLSSKVFWGVIGFIFLILFILFVEGLVQLNKYNKALSEFETYLNNGDITSLNLANTVLNNIKTIENGPNRYMITPRYDELKRKLDEKREGGNQQNDSEGVSIGILNSKIELSSYEVMDSGGKGGHVDITVITDAENYTATSNQSWCKITNQNDTSFRIEIEANATDSTREAIVTVTAGPQPKSVVVTQKPKPNDISATNSNSTNSSSSSSATQNKPKKTEQTQSAVQTITIGVPGYNSNIEMVYVEGGTFKMGATSEQGSDAFNDERPTHNVTLHSYYIGKYEVTQGLWEAVMGDNPSWFRKKEKNIQ